MKLFTKVTTLMLALLLTGGVAFAATYNEHVSVAPNGQGEVLIFPVYFAVDGGFQTKLQVINTSLVQSAVAKVVFRSPYYSQEILDFLIFLSPTDVWEGFVKWQGGQSVLVTVDDSHLKGIDSDGDPIFASPANEEVIALLPPACDVAWHGYVEVFLVHVFDTEVNVPGTPKEDIFEEFVGSGTFRSPNPDSGDTPGALYLQNNYAYLTNILAGNQQVQNDLIGWTSALNAVALKDYGYQSAAAPLEETTFGQEARNSMVEVEAALSKNFVGMPYINNAEGNTLHSFTFPTKLTELDADCDVERWEGEFEGFDKVKFTVRQMDMTEDTPAGDQPIYSPLPDDLVDSFPFEVNFIGPAAFDEGWYRYRFTAGNTDDFTKESLFGNVDGDYLEYTGAPVIPVVFNLGAAGLSAMYGFWEDGSVYGTEDGGVPTPNPSSPWQLEGYQYIRSFAGTVDTTP